MSHETGQSHNAFTQHAQIVAKTWLDPELKTRLLTSPATVLREHGIAVPTTAEVRVVEDTDRVVYVHLPSQPAIETCTLEQLAQVVGGGYGKKVKIDFSEL
jgi:hypothetical protein